MLAAHSTPPTAPHIGIKPPDDERHALRSAETAETAPNRHTTPEHGHSSSSRRRLLPAEPLSTRFCGLGRALT